MAYHQSENPVFKHSFEFSIGILKVADDLQNEGATISNQISRSDNKD
jgi:hypothetical protein